MPKHSKLKRISAGEVPDPSRRALLKGAGLLALAGTMPVLSACSFRPVHGEFAANRVTSAKLDAIEIAPLSGRVGIKLRNELIFALRGGDREITPDYRLEIALRENILSTMVASNGRATRQVVQLAAQYKLIKLPGTKPVMRGTGHSQAAFEKFSSGFANVRAQIDAENRAATQLANAIKTRVTAYISRIG